MFNNSKKIDEKRTVSGTQIDTVNVISKETSITGDIQALGNIRIEGSVDGTIYSKGRVLIGEVSVTKGNITSVEAEIYGKVEGEVICSEILFLKKNAIILGNITTKKLVVENGAVFNGKCQMNSKALVVSKSDEKNEAQGKQVAAG